MIRSMKAFPFPFIKSAINCELFTKLYIPMYKRNSLSFYYWFIARVRKAVVHFTFKLFEQHNV